LGQTDLDRLPILAVAQQFLRRQWHVKVQEMAFPLFETSVRGVFAESLFGAKWIVAVAQREEKTLIPEGSRRMLAPL
jgi:hypothetical protein